MISNQKMKSKERDKSILEYVHCIYNNVHIRSQASDWNCCVRDRERETGEGEKE